MKTKHQLKQLKDKSFTIELTLGAQDIKREYQHVLGEIQATFEKKGFRKGKAPLDVVEQNISPQSVIEEVLNHLLPKAYKEIVNEHQLKPVTEPTIKIKTEKLSLDSDWVLELESAELPEIKIDPKLIVDIKKLNKDKKIEKKIKTEQIASLIIKHTNIVLPSILLNNDVNRRLSDLVKHLESANLTLDQYLKNKKITLPQHREELEAQIKNDWALNLGINQIAIEQKLKIDEAEVKAIFAKSPELKNDPNLVYYLLTQQKVLDYLESIS
ncbi:MAG: Trigger factor [Candidatus Shapirobacteria bacterium GW2011_GWE1_38_10]|uniref:Trigger factor n=1 Tax=Candidatus Shapirobacteria bacterium GW2011_GWE1_38_10 TaxID=1618488 RepID=A0A0G0I736_9BACT|nr:MAG: Trigger factor [Candidatus Shapirobacteria bacterium GW2011_GWF2_37_20]KKQ50362.1 MAG: Trigger factor [Candidatus Shapirobacteria bacterium GW2011_GWE1_38_10]KKQ65186.1 MAG: Trigger factor [Candidatus Shapirobacteria bacterium GW2011_GWF1_38_23]